MGAANVSDALRALGKAFQSLDGGIHPVHSSMKLAGPAFTVRCYPGATWAMEQALELALPGDVLVVDGGACPDLILMGGLMSTRAKARGLAGVVLDGAVRDVHDIIDLGFPVFSRHIAARAGTFAEIGEWQVTVCCGRVPVSPGDWIVGDRNGVVVVPPGLREQAFAKAREINAKEAALAPHLADGKDFKESIAAFERSVGAK
jgi:4-hydroxy-4-methyl-2-oxoglutarate aldolase